MTTRLYLPASTASTPISPTPDSAWEDTSILGRAITRPSSIADAMATVSFADNDATDKDILFRQYVSQPLVTGQTITGAQAIKAQCRVAERATTCNSFLTLGIRVIASDGTTVRKTVLAVNRDNTEASTSLTNRAFTATSAATNYTTQAGDRLVIEIGTAGDPGNGSDHDSDLRLGDSAASDLAEDDASTTDNRPWVQLNDTLAFIFTASASITHGPTTGSGSATFAVPVYTASASLTHGPTTETGSATFVTQSFFTGMATLTRSGSTLTASGGTSSPHTVGKITQPVIGLYSRRYGTFVGKSSTPPYSEATASLTHGATTLTASGWTSSPHLVGKITQPRFGLYGKRYGSFASKGATQYTAAASLTRGPSTLSASAQFTPPTSTGTASLTHTGSTLTASATHVTPTFTATASMTHGGSTLSASATFTPPSYTGTATLTRSGSTFTGIALFAAEVYQGESIVSVGAATLSGTATFVPPSYTGTASLTHTGSTFIGSAIFAPLFAASASLQHGPSTFHGTARTVFGSGLIIKLIGNGGGLIGRGGGLIA